MNLETIRPLNDNVLVRLDKPEEETRNGVIIPATAREPRSIDAVWGTVLRVGPGYYANGKFEWMDGDFVPISVRPGDRVLVDSKLAGDYVMEKEDPYVRMVREAQIHAVVEP